MPQPKDPAVSGEKKGEMRIDPKLVRELAELLTSNALTEIEVADGERPRGRVSPHSGAREVMNEMTIASPIRAF